MPDGRKPGRPRRQQTRSTRPCTFNVTPEERELLEEAARVCGVTLSQYLRDATLDCARATLEEP